MAKGKKGGKKANMTEEERLLFEQQKVNKAKIRLDRE